MGFAVSFVVLATGTALTVTVTSPKTGPNLQTVGLLLMLVALTALNVVMAVREPAERQRRGTV